MSAKVRRDHLLDESFKAQVIICYTFRLMDTLDQRNTNIHKKHKFVLAGNCSVLAGTNGNFRSSKKRKNRGKRKFSIWLSVILSNTLPVTVKDL